MTTEKMRPLTTIGDEVDLGAIDRAAPPNPQLFFLGEFNRNVYARLRKGGAVYGERSFSRDPLDLLTEVMEELEDVCGWGFILWTRLRTAQRVIQCLREADSDEE